MCVGAHRGPKKFSVPKKLGAEVTDSCEPTDMGAGNKPESSQTVAAYLNC